MVPPSALQAMIDKNEHQHSCEEASHENTSPQVLVLIKLAVLLVASFVLYFVQRAKGKPFKKHSDAYGVHAVTLKKGLLSLMIFYLLAALFFHWLNILQVVVLVIGIIGVTRRKRAALIIYYVAEITLLILFVVGMMFYLSYLFRLLSTHTMISHHSHTMANGVKCNSPKPSAKIFLLEECISVVTFAVILCLKASTIVQARKLSTMTIANVMPYLDEEADKFMDGSSSEEEGSDSEEILQHHPVQPVYIVPHRFAQPVGLPQLYPLAPGAVNQI